LSGRFRGVVASLDRREFCVAASPTPIPVIGIAPGFLIVAIPCLRRHRRMGIAGFAGESRSGTAEPCGLRHRRGDRAVCLRRAFFLAGRYWYTAWNDLCLRSAGKSHLPGAGTREAWPEPALFVAIVVTGLRLATGIAGPAMA